MSLPADLKRLEDVRELCGAFEAAGFRTMLAGGCVRDRLLMQVPNDYDLATVATPDEMVELAKERSWRMIPVGIEHGTIAIVTALQTIEVTTLRHDVDCDGRHAKVSFTQSFAEDAKRRDLTINALFEDRNGEIHDFVGGVDDLKRQRLRFVGDASQRIQEDFLRSLRYFRFLAKLGWASEPNQIAAIREHRHRLRGLSMERVLAEYNKLLVADHAVKAFRLMDSQEIHQSLFEWYRVNDLDSLLKEMETVGPGDLNLRWFSFLWHAGLMDQGREAVDAALTALRMPRKSKRLFSTLSRIFDATREIDPREADVLHLGEKHKVDFAAMGRLLKLRVPEFVKLWHGLQQRTQAPTVQPEWLMQQPAHLRGRIVEAAKICWYLGLWDGKRSLDEFPRIQSILHHRP
jgi:tRNA nucleotidyltransferase/poly(A) polymerase